MKGACFYSILVSGGLSLLWSAPAHAGLDMKEGRWRLELNNDFGVHQGSRDRKGDYSANGVVEYEIPATPRTTLGLRVLPLFFDIQNDGDDYRYFKRIFNEEGEGGGTVWGGASVLADVSTK